MAEVIDGMLVEAGAVVVGTTASVDATRDFLGEHKVDLVCLDIRLGWEDSFLLADVLAAHDIPFVFLTVYDPDSVPRRHRGHPFVDKTEMTEGLVAACMSAAATHATVQR